MPLSSTISSPDQISARWRQLPARAATTSASARAPSAVGSLDSLRSPRLRGATELAKPPPPLVLAWAISLRSVPLLALLPCQEPPPSSPRAGECQAWLESRLVSVPQTLHLAQTRGCFEQPDTAQFVHDACCDPMARWHGCCAAIDAEFVDLGGRVQGLSDAQSAPQRPAYARRLQPAPSGLDTSENIQTAKTKTVTGADAAPLRCARVAPMQPAHARARLSFGRLSERRRRGGGAIRVERVHRGPARTESPRVQLQVITAAHPPCPLCRARALLPLPSELPVSARPLPLLAPTPARRLCRHYSEALPAVHPRLPPLLTAPPGSRPPRLPPPTAPPNFPSRPCARAARTRPPCRRRRLFELWSAL